MDNVPDIVDLVLYFLGVLSVTTWAILIYKLYIFKQLERLNHTYTQTISKHTKLAQLNIAHADNHHKQSKQGTLSHLSFTMLNNLKCWNHDDDIDQSTYAALLNQSLKQEQHNQHAKLESGMTVLASVGSTAPFVGLFGTVWGIMHALKGISATGSAGLDVVAGPIGEALIATAMGIAAAIPAVLAYNFLLRRVRLAAADMGHFSERIQILAKRSSYKVD